MSDSLKRFLGDSYHLGEVPSGALLLNKNAHYEWYIIVPHGEFVEWFDLPLALQQNLLGDINAISEFLKREGRRVDKINVGSIGNIVPRFHLHILSRRKDDPAWPGPVWGHSAFIEYTSEMVCGIVEDLGGELADFTPAPSFF